MDIENFVNKKLTKTGEMPNGDNIYLITEKSVNDIKKQLGISSADNHSELLLAYHRYLTEELSLDLHEIWVDEHLKANNCG